MNIYGYFFLVLLFFLFVPSLILFFSFKVIRLLYILEIQEEKLLCKLSTSSISYASFNFQFVFFFLYCTCKHFVYKIDPLHKNCNIYCAIKLNKIKLAHTVVIYRTWLHIRVLRIFLKKATFSMTKVMNLSVFECTTKEGF